jgi:hypothetical protein
LRVRSERACRGRHVDVVLAGNCGIGGSTPTTVWTLIVHLERMADDAEIGAEGVLPSA